MKITQTGTATPIPIFAPELKEVPFAVSSVAGEAGPVALEAMEVVLLLVSVDVLLLPAVLMSTPSLLITEMDVEELGTLVPVMPVNAPGSEFVSGIALASLSVRVTPFRKAMRIRFSRRRT